MIEIRDHRVYVDGKAVLFRRSPNVSGRLNPRGIIVHDTAGDLVGAGSVSWLCNPAAKASAHVVVDRAGQVTQLVPFNVVAWHAGASSWRGKANCNAFTIGIEIVNPGKLVLWKNGYKQPTPDKNGKPQGVQVPAHFDVRPATTPQHGSGFWLGYTAEQLAAVRELCQALRQAYPAIDFIAPHWEIAPGRKIDTNPRFPLGELRASVFAPAHDQAPPALADAVLYDDGALERARLEPLPPFDPTIERTAPAAAADPVTELVQRRLADLGYFEVGEADGKAGSRTAGAILAFRHDNGLPLKTSIDDQLLAALGRAAPRPVSAARQAATVKDLRARGSKTTGLLDRIKILFGGLFGTAIAAGGADLGLLDQVTDHALKLGSLKSALAPFGIGLGAVVLLGLVAGAGYLAAELVQRRRLAEYRSGKNP